MRAAGVVSEELLDGETVVTTGDRSRAVVLNPMGAAVLELCDGQHSVGEISEFICQNVAVAAPARVQEDVEKLLVELADVGVVELG